MKPDGMLVWFKIKEHKHGISNLINSRTTGCLAKACVVYFYCHNFATVQHFKFISIKASKLLPSFKLCTALDIPLNMTSFTRKNLEFWTRQLQFFIQYKHTPCTSKLKNNFPGILCNLIKFVSILYFKYFSCTPVRKAYPVHPVLMIYVTYFQARRKICDVVDTYIHEQIDVAGEAICNRVIEKIADGDVILTYGW